MIEYDDEWQLIPELSFYEEGQPPASGEYRVRVRDGHVEISIGWVSADGRAHAIEFGGPLDGERHPSEQPGVAEVSFTLVDDLTLDSAAYAHDGAVVAYARRRKSSDGALLATLQRGSRSDGTTFGNTQVYRRKSESEDR